MAFDQRAASGASAVYGRPPAELADVPEDAIQVSPLIPGAACLEDAAEAAFGRAALLAPPGTTERRFVLAHALRALRPNAPLTVLAPNDKGGKRVAAELEAFGCAVAVESRRHHRIALTNRPPVLSGLEEAIEAGAPRFDAALGLWTQAGVFSVDRIDPGTRLLLDNLPALSGRGADLGCGVGVLGRSILASAAAVTFLASIDLDRRAVDAARRNLADARAAFRWADLREPQPEFEALDFAVSNPPFHDGGREDRALGKAFVQRAFEMLRRGGVLRLVANRHLPFEAVLAERFARVATVAETGGYKLFEARR